MATGSSRELEVAPALLGAIFCHGCCRERAEAEDRSEWTIVMVSGVLTEVVCPRCEGRRP
jgi:hypothetical protein